MMKENWERKLFYLLTPALMGDTGTATLWDREAGTRVSKVRADTGMEVPKVRTGHWFPH